MQKRQRQVQETVAITVSEKNRQGVKGRKKGVKKACRNVLQAGSRNRDNHNFEKKNVKGVKGRKKGVKKACRTSEAGSRNRSNHSFGKKIEKA